MEEALRVYLPEVLVKLCGGYHIPMLEIDISEAIKRQYQGLVDRYCDAMVEDNLIYYVDISTLNFRIMRKTADFKESVALIKPECPFYQGDNKGQLYLHGAVLRSYFNKKVPTGKIIKKWDLPRVGVRSLVKYKDQIYFLVVDGDRWCMIVYNLKGQIIRQFDVNDYWCTSMGNFVIYRDLICIVSGSGLTNTCVSRFSLDGDLVDQQQFIAGEETMFFDSLTLFEDRLYAVNLREQQMAELGLT